MTVHDSDKHCCKLCGEKTLPVYGYSMQLPSVVELKAYSEEDDEWLDVDFRICPKCGSVFGKVNDEQR